jgi:hypothetical protein
MGSASYVDFDRIRPVCLTPLWGCQSTSCLGVVLVTGLSVMQATHRMQDPPCRKLFLWQLLQVK